MAFTQINIQGTTQVGDTDILPFVARDLVAYDKASVPLTTMMQKIGRIDHTPVPEFFSGETQYDDPSATCNGILAAGAGASQTIVINSLNVRALMRFLEPVNEQLMIVLSVTSYNNNGTTTAVVKRVPSTTATIAISGTPLLVRIDTQLLEGDFYPQPASVEVTRIPNRIGSISDAIAITNIMNDTPTFWNKGSEFDLQRTAVVERFRKSMERYIIWSQSYRETMTHTVGSNSWSNIAWSGDGILNQIKTNIIPYMGSVTESGLDDLLGNTVWGTRYYGSDFKVGFGGTTVFQNINGFAKNRIRINDMGPSKAYGLNVTSYLGYAGQQKLYLILEREFMNDNPQYASSLVVIDPLNLKIMYHGAALMMVKNTTMPNQAQISMAMESRPGVHLSFEKSHAIYQKAA